MIGELKVEVGADSDLLEEVGLKTRGGMAFLLEFLTVVARSAKICWFHFVNREEGIEVSQAGKDV